ncbi:SxtJ family membrane protein [Lacinutrix jangbogonensis]|uniref:SxtJ family membrane protein n=1 Tax=Lacinutrix jangbogonensis TaxID=1469557 RepID=UPI00053DCA6C|nr:SxtJ family membrane protein [Lacinutrix jangbogonensis]
MSWINETIEKTLTNAKQPKKLFQFGVLIIAVLLIGLVLSFYKHGFIFDTNQLVIASLLGLSLCITFLFRTLWTPFLFIWLCFGEILGLFTSTLILGIVYFLIFSPIAFIINLTGKKERYKSGWLKGYVNEDYKNLG